MHHATVAAGLVHRDGVFLLDDLDADAWVPLLQAVCDGQTQHPRTDDPHSLPAHRAPSGSVSAADGRLTRMQLTWRSSHPPRHIPGQAALSCTTLLRQDGEEGLTPPFELSAPHGARGSRLNGDRGRR